MKSVLILGAGMVVAPIVDYLLERNYRVTVASRTLKKAEGVINNHSNGIAIEWDVEDVDALKKLVAHNDIVVSLLPYTFHVQVAEICLKYGKNMVTTSYVSEVMKSLHQKAIDKDIIILNEVGLDPGIDHMTAMEIIDKVHDANGSIDGFYSLCGALCDVESSQNPFRYKFSWSPKGVVMASNNDAQYLMNDEVRNIPTSALFKEPLEIDFPEIEKMHVYPNRDSLPYIDIYGIPETKTMYRGTFRYQGWCEALDLLKSLKLTGTEEINVEGKSFAQITAELNDFNLKNLKSEICSRFELDPENSGLKAIEWLGVLSDTKFEAPKTSPFELVSDLMIQKMMTTETDRDMVLMQHIFDITTKEGEKQQLIARLVDYGNEQYSSIAKTVAIPAAIAVEMILEKQIDIKGVHIPISKAIYKPILQRLKEFGIQMEEEIK